MILPVVIVVLDGTSPDIDRDVGTANVVWGNDCGVFVEIAETLVVDRPDLLVLSQADCNFPPHAVSAEEDELFSLGRGLGADVVAYYIGGSSFGDNVLGCAAHPPDRRGFWVVHDTTFGLVWAHEVTHVVGENPHVNNTSNLMHPFADEVTNLPPDLNEEQCRRIIDDPALLSIESIVLNL
ncbi:MAG TPA: hypothetical protein VFR81_26095 [Longimicrobium sp.]|nr:hypothetical protein [Longimicrobium sp.]